MKLILIALLLTGMTFASANEISMVGVKIHDHSTALKKIKLEVLAKDKKEGMIKFRTENGNELSFTSKEGKVVYMENDWLHDDAADVPLFSNFRFGKTSLRDIRKTLGTNGFTHVEHAGFTSDKEAIEFNCFEFDSPNHEIFATVTTVPLGANVSEENVADSLKLAAVIIADKDYLDKIWGEKKVFDEGNYKKIKAGF
ncbi:MAG: hypothetical protein Q8916_01050 [Bacteroidota bacterium]|nr:hypothetical protein [Bacteroidota bacterium]MDP4228974.1 hypothetical protein [Bacteroidota bacterium]MDP4237103.1 hypothetical protein [Bacteroidota bacterium]